MERQSCGMHMSAPAEDENGDFQTSDARPSGLTLAGSWPEPVEIEQMCASRLRGDVGAEAENEAPADPRREFDHAEEICN